MWQAIQVRSPKKLKILHIVGKLSLFPLGISELNKTGGIGKRTHQDTTIIFKLRMAKISEFHQVEYHPTE
jgi:hypothetical protein